MTASMVVEFHRPVGMEYIGEVSEQADKQCSSMVSASVLAARFLPEVPAPNSSSDRFITREL